MVTADKVRQAVADIAATPMQMPLTKWNEVCGILLAAADEIERLRLELAGDKLDVARRIEVLEQKMRHLLPERDIMD